MKITRYTGRIVFIAVLLTVSLLFLFRETILLNAGRFMAPEASGNADVVILEGTESIEAGAVAEGINLLSSGRAARIIVVIHEMPVQERSFALPDNYPSLVKRNLKNAGLKEEQFRIIRTPVHKPITLTEATIVLQTLSKEGVESAILLSAGFHTRRSFLAYRQAGAPLNIRIIPRAFFNHYHLDNWWFQDPGMHDFLSEVFKLGYYQIRGYLPERL